MFDLNTWPLPTPAAYRVNSEQHLQQLNGDRDCRLPGAPVQFLCVDTRYLSHGRCRIKLAAKAALLNHLSMHCNLVLGIVLLFGWLLDRGLECATIRFEVCIVCCMVAGQEQTYFIVDLCISRHGSRSSLKSQ
jgi:hypothetical protein